MTKKYKKQNYSTNYTFLLKCIVAITAAAVATVGVIAAVSQSPTVAATTAVATKMMLASTFAFTSIFPIALIAIGLICIFSRNNTQNIARAMNPGSNYYSFYSTPLYFNAHEYNRSDSVYVPESHVHSHDFSHVHSHDSSHMYNHDSSHMHNHDSSHMHNHGSSHMHNHGSSHVHNHGSSHVHNH